MVDREDLETCHDIVEYATRNRCVRPDSYSNHNVWLTARQISWEYSQDYAASGGKMLSCPLNTRLLQAAAKAGVIVQHDFATANDKRAQWRYTTVRLAADYAMETGLSDSARGARSAEAIRRLYEENVRERGDRVDLWPVNARRLAAVPQGGIDHAVKNCLVVETRDGFVPWGQFDVYNEAIINYRSVQELVKQRRDRLISAVHALVGGSEHNLTRLSVDQLERILALSVDQLERTLAAFDNTEP